MTKTITIANNRRITYTHKLFKDDVESYSVDVTPLSDDYGAATAATITINDGSVTASTPAVASDIISFNITQPDKSDSAFTLAVTFTNGQIRNIHFYVNGLNWEKGYTNVEGDYACRQI